MCGQGAENGVLNLQLYIKGVFDFFAQSIKDVLGFSVPKEGPMSDADKWGPDMVRLIAEGIESEQDRLIRQVERMSQAMEDAFDPNLTAQVAAETTNAIRAHGRGGSSGQGGADGGISLTVNMDISGVTVRSDADIDRLAEEISRRMAAATRRELAGRL